MKLSSRVRWWWCLCTWCYLTRYTWIFHVARAVLQQSFPNLKVGKTIFSLSETLDLPIPILKSILNIFLFIYSKNIISSSYWRIGNLSKNMNEERDWQYHEQNATKAREIQVKFSYFSNQFFLATRLTGWRRNLDSVKYCYCNYDVTFLQLCWWI